MVLLKKSQTQFFCRHRHASNAIITNTYQLLNNNKSNNLIQLCHRYNSQSLLVESTTSTSTRSLFSSSFISSTTTTTTFERYMNHKGTNNYFRETTTKYPAINNIKIVSSHDIRRIIHHHNSNNNNDNNNNNNNRKSYYKTKYQRFISMIGLIGSWYSHHIDHNPIITKSITSGIIASTGDVVCQTLQHRQQNQKQQEQGDDTSETSSKIINSSSSLMLFDSWDITRTVRFMTVGILLVGPVCHYWYNMLAFVLVPSNTLSTVVSSRTAFIRVLYDQFIFSPCFIIIWTSCFHFIKQIQLSLASNLYINDSTTTTKTCNTISTLFQQTYDDTYQQLSKNFQEILMVNWLLWIPCQFLNFKLIPLKFQVLCSNIVALIWNVYLSYTTSLSNSKSNSSSSNSSSSNSSSSNS